MRLFKAVQVASVMWLCYALFFLIHISYEFCIAMRIIVYPLFIGILGGLLNKEHRYFTAAIFVCGLALITLPAVFLGIDVSHKLKPLLYFISECAVVFIGAGISMYVRGDREAKP